MVTTTYNSLAKALHWLVFLLLVAQFTVAWTMPHIGRGAQPVGLIAWHFSIGMTILLVVLIRLGWRTVSIVPPVPADLSPALRLLSRVTHALLYAVMIALPVLGWINANARGFTAWLLGVVPMPALVSTASPFGGAMGDIHQIFAWVLLGAAGLHVLGALYHQFILRDGLLRRMVPGLR
jgi:cytochrome b561